MIIYIYIYIYLYLYLYQYIYIYIYIYIIKTLAEEFYFSALQITLLRRVFYFLFVSILYIYIDTL